MSTLNLRIIHTHDTEENWNKNNQFIPQCGELIVYDIDNSYKYQRFKIGDGVTDIKDLPFTCEASIRSLFNTKDNVIFADAGRITDYK